MAQQPAVVIVARHGPRLDAADQSWHLSTPTPYDPPLTYGGWNQCRALGTRIATLLHAREQEVEAANESDGVKTFDFAARNHDSTRGSGQGTAAAGSRPQTPRTRKRRKHKVVIHTSPFLRCLQTSVAIAAGMAQYAPAVEAANQQASRRKSMSRSSSTTATGLKRQEFSHSSLPRRNGGTHEQQHQQRPRRSRIRVDPFLGEWLNPQYFEDILPPPPSPMMVATAKAELMQNDAVDTFVPSTLNKPSGGNLWGSVPKDTSGASALEDWSQMQQQLPTKNRDRASSHSSVGSSGGSSSRPRSRGGSAMISRLPRPEFSVYSPPTPHYAVSSSDLIPRGYFAHARNACANVDYHWDSSRAPLLWGDGGEYGEEWSAMHKRFRRGLNHMIEWYSRHNADDRSEDALGIDQAERDLEEEVEELVVILVTHGAGCNALIGALTGQPVLLDVGMASLTMAVRKDDAPPVVTYASSTAPSPDRTPNGTPAPEKTNGSLARRGSLDLGLSSIYEMKLVASSEHLRPRSGTDRRPSPSTRADVQNARDTLNKNRQRFGSVPYSMPSASNSTGDLGNSTSRGSNTNAALGSIRRPSATNTTTTSSSSSPLAIHEPALSNSALAIGESISQPATPGLWTPPASRTPNPQQQQQKQQFQPPRPHMKELTAEEIGPLDEDITGSDQGGPTTPGSLLSESISSISATTTEGSSTAEKGELAPLEESHDSFPPAPVLERPAGIPMNGRTDGAADERPGTAGSSDGDVVGDLPQIDGFIPSNLSRGLSQKGLWGAKPSGDRVRRSLRDTPKRRWTVNEEK